MSEVIQIPKLRFSEFTEGWLNKKYNEIYIFYSTNSFSRDNLNYEEGEVKNIHYGDIHTKFSTLFDLNKELVPFINKEVNISRIKEENYVREGDLLIADASEDYSDIGKTVEVVNINNKKVLSGLHTFHARPNKYEMASGFAGYMLQNWNVRKQVMKIAQGTKVLGLATSRLGNITLNIPEFEEQQKIASFLTAVDKKISQLQNKRTLLQDYKKGVTQQIFNQKLRFQDEEGNDYPDWEEKKLVEIANFRRGSFPQPYGLKKWYDDENGFPFIQVYDVAGNLRLKVTTKRKISEQAKKLSVFVKKGTLILTIQGSIGRMAITEYDACVDRTLLIFQSYNLPVDKTYFMYVVYLLFEFEKQRAVGGTIKTITKEKLSKFKVKLPCLEEQTKIANFLSAIDTKIEMVNTQIKNTQQFKKGLLQHMFV